MALETATDLRTSIVTISEEAYNKLMGVITNQKRDNLFLRVYVQGGCGGVNFGMAIDMRQMPDDKEFQVNDLKVVVDRISYPYVEGAIINYESVDGGKEGFRITNPNATELMSQTGACCGGSAQSEAGGCGAGACGAGASDGGGCC